MKKKKRGYGWARPKGFNRKHSRARKDDVSVNTEQQQSSEMTRKTKPSLTARRTTFSEDFKALIHHRFPERFVHSDACHFFDENGDCAACWEDWKMDLYARCLVRGHFG